MKHQDPKQAIVEYLVHSLNRVKDSPVQAHTIQILKERSISPPHGFTPVASAPITREKREPGLLIFDASGPAGTLDLASLCYVVTFQDQSEQHRYALMMVAQKAVGSWEVVTYHLIGQRWDPKHRPGELEHPPCAQFGVSIEPAFFYAAGYVWHPEVEIRSVGLRDASGLVFEEQVENEVVLFVSNQHVDRPLTVELFTPEHILIEQSSL